VWAKAQERITELKANEVRKKEAKSGYLFAIQRWLFCIRSETKSKTTMCSKIFEARHESLILILHMLLCAENLMSF
jgi:hypothetical protein